jgi:flagellar biogenesis protein FliO
LVPPPVKPGGDLAGTVRVVAGVGLVVIGLLGFALWRRSKTPIQEAFGLKIVSRARLDHKSSIAVLEVGGAVLIVGLSDHGPRLLARLDDGETMDSNPSENTEAERLRALVGHNPADRLGAWMHAAQSGREAPAEPAEAPKAEERTEPDERVDLRRRLAEIRRTCSD